MAREMARRDGRRRRSREEGDTQGGLALHGLGGVGERGGLRVKAQAPDDGDQLGRKVAEPCPGTVGFRLGRPAVLGAHTAESRRANGMRTEPERGSQEEVFGLVG